MTRKDYRLIAGVIASRALYLDGKDEHMARLLVSDIADALASDNRAFDRDRFLSACGLDQESGISDREARAHVRSAFPGARFNR
jgi:hypothetical protein